MSQPPKKLISAAFKFGGSQYFDTLPICPLCGAAVHVASIIHLHHDDGRVERIVVCQRHMPNSAICKADANVAAIACSYVFAELKQTTPLIRQPGQRPPLWRPATRAQIVPIPAADVGQAALARRARWSAAGFLDRALELLAELVARLFSAGERVPASPNAAATAARIGCDRSHRGETEAPVS